MLQEFRTDVGGWVHRSIQGESISDDLTPKRYQLSPDSTPVTISEEVAAAQPTSPHLLFELSPYHRRSYELGNSPAIRESLPTRAVWRDEFKNPYTSYSLKGNNFTYGSIMTSASAPSGYIPQGLLESDALLRVIRSSRLLREAGVSTEWVSRVFEPSELIYKGERVSQAEYKKRLLLDAAKTRGIEEMGRIATAIKPMTFFITGRSMEIGDRMADFETDTPELAKSRISHIFQVYNRLHKRDKNFQPLDPNNVDDIKRYVTDIFPYLLGRNFAKMHNAGLVHSFPSFGNINALGGLVDLDGVKGQPLEMGDEPTSLAARAQDFLRLDEDRMAFSMNHTYQSFERLGIIQNWEYVQHRAQSELLISYINHRNNPSNELEEHQEDLYLSAFSIPVSAGLGSPRYHKLHPEGHTEVFDRLRAEVFAAYKQMNTPEFLVHNALAYIDKELRREVFKVVKVEAEVEGEEEGERIEISDPSVLLDPKFIEKFIKKVTRTLMSFTNHTSYYTSNISDELAKDEQIAFATDIPEENVRAALAQGFVRRVSVKQDELINRFYSRGRHKRNHFNRVRRIVRKQVAEIASQIKEDSWGEFLVGRLDIGVESSSSMILNGQAVHAYGNIPIGQLIATARAADVPIQLVDLTRQTDVFTSHQQEGVRALITSEEDPELLHRHYLDAASCVRIEPKDNFVIGDDNYLAWVRRDVDGQPISIGLQVTNMEAARKLLRKSAPKPTKAPDS